jgi:hypothetical protein
MSFVHPPFELRGGHESYLRRELRYEPDVRRTIGREQKQLFTRVKAERSARRAPATLTVPRRASASRKGRFRRSSPERRDAQPGASTRIGLARPARRFHDTAPLRFTRANAARLSRPGCRPLRHPGRSPRRQLPGRQHRACLTVSVSGPRGGLRARDRARQLALEPGTRHNSAHERPLTRRLDKHRVCGGRVPEESLNVGDARAAYRLPVDGRDSLPRGHDVTDRDLIVPAAARRRQELQGPFALNVVGSDESGHHVIAHDEERACAGAHHLAQRIVDGAVFGDGYPGSVLKRGEAR